MLSQDMSGGRVWAGRMGSRGWLAGAALAVIAILGGGPVLAAGPPNDAFGAARPIALAEHVELETGGATLQDREPKPACNRGAGASVWFTFTPKEDGRYAADTFESGYDTVVAVYKGGWLGGLKPLACSDDAGGPTSYAIFNARAGIPYRIQVTGDRARTGSLDLVLGYAPDVTGPRIRGPVSTLVTGVPMGRATVTRWSARDKQSGVARYEVQVSRDGGRFEPITLDPGDRPQRGRTPPARSARAGPRPCLEPPADALDLVGRARVHAPGHPGGQRGRDHQGRLGPARGRLRIGWQHPVVGAAGRTRHGQGDSANGRESWHPVARGEARPRSCWTARPWPRSIWVPPSGSPARWSSHAHSRTWGSTRSRSRSWAPPGALAWTSTPW